ncbi:MAG: peptidoglycan-binding protein [Lachnospiraceae bacterium]|nr:peptidoglycan-binding protein [Lachnospiraceae bacterium]
MATQAQVKAFINKIAPIAQAKASGRSEWSLPSVCIAQCCCESAYGTSLKMKNANALLGIKVGKSKVHFGQAWKDKAYSTQTKECYDGKTYVNITDMFRAYDSINDAIEDYFDMLASCSRYKGCLNQTDARACITAIKNGGYATDPAYVTTIMSIINKYNLTQYDSVMTGKSSNGTVARATVRYGSRGADVTYLQQQLNAKGYNVGSVDGIYGNKTLAAVKVFQADNGLVVDGIVGPKTYEKLQNS